MKKREFIKTGSILTIGALTVPLTSCQNSGSKNVEADGSQSEGVSVFELPELPYSVSELEPYIDQRTMEIHHGKHHAGYVKKLNAALEGHDLAGKALTDIVKSVTKSDTGVRNNGGGHYNHSLFWKIMKPGGGDSPSGKLLDALNSTFGSLDAFQEKFAGAAGSRFGSGWAWLSVNKKNKLFISSTPNQDNPLMSNLVENPGAPILGIDVWEHAYYLKYQNKRNDYITNFMKIINWEEVAKNYDQLI